MTTKQKEEKPTPINRPNWGGTLTLKGVVPHKKKDGDSK